MFASPRCEVVTSNQPRSSTRDHRSSSRCACNAAFAHGAGPAAIVEDTLADDAVGTDTVQQKQAAHLGGDI